MPRPSRPDRKRCALAGDACASALRAVDGERDFREASYDECGTAEGSLRIRVQRYLSCTVATAFHLWSATPYPVEITGGQSFGEAQGIALASKEAFAPVEFSSETISFLLRQPAQVQLELVDLTGRTVKTIFSGPVSEGAHKVPMNRDALHAGVYFVKLKAGKETFVSKVVFE